VQNVLGQQHRPRGTVPVPPPPPPPQCPRPVPPVRAERATRTRPNRQGAGQPRWSRLRPHRTRRCRPTRLRRATGLRADACGRRHLCGPSSGRRRSPTEKKGKHNKICTRIRPAANMHRVSAMVGKGRHSECRLCVEAHPTGPIRATLPAAHASTTAAVPHVGGPRGNQAVFDTHGFTQRVPRSRRANGGATAVTPPTTPPSTSPPKSAAATAAATFAATRCRAHSQCQYAQRSTCVTVCVGEARLHRGEHIPRAAHCLSRHRVRGSRRAALWLDLTCDRTAFAPATGGAARVRAVPPMLLYEAWQLGSHP